MRERWHAGHIRLGESSHELDERCALFPNRTKFHAVSDTTSEVVVSGCSCEQTFARLVQANQGLRWDTLNSLENGGQDL